MSETGQASKVEFDPKLVELRDRLSKAFSCDMPCACLRNPQSHGKDCGSVAHEFFAELTRLQQSNAALVEAAEPFAKLGRQLNAAIRGAIPDDVSASRLNLTGIQAKDFKALATAIATQSAERT